MQGVDLFLRQCKKPFNSETHNIFDRHHATILGPNLHDASTEDSAFSSERIGGSGDLWSIAASYPIPVGPPVRMNRAAANGQNPAQNLFHLKCLYDKERDVLLAACRKHVRSEKLDEIRNAVESGSVLLQLDPTVAALAEHLAKDPAPDFKGCYNQCYFNSLVNIDIAERSFLVYPQASQLLLVQEIGSETQQRFTLGHGMDESGTIFQLDSSNDIISLRQSDQIRLHRFMLDEVPALEKLFTVKDEKSILANCFSKFTASELMVLSSDSTLTVYDLESKAPKHTLQGQFTDDSWGCILHQSQNVVMLCNRSTARLVDLRTNIAADDWNIGSVTECCEEICSACSGQSLQYVSTSHHLLSLDLRKGWFQKWTHGLSNPFISHSIQDGATDLLFITGDAFGDIAYIHNSHTTEFDIDFIRRVPAHLPSMRECLHDARTLGHLCSPMVQPRFSMPTVGLQIVEKRNDYSVYFCTSVGDLFSQRLRVGSTACPLLEFQDGELETYREWMDECHRMQTDPDIPIKATELRDATRFLDFFNADTCPAESTECYDVPNEPQVRQKWMRSKRQLLKYCDVLAPRILSVWDIDDDDEWGGDWPSDDEPGEESSSSSDEVNSRVLSWLSQSEHRPDNL